MGSGGQESTLVVIYMLEKKNLCCVIEVVNHIFLEISSILATYLATGKDSAPTPTVRTRVYYRCITLFNNLSEKMRLFRHITGEICRQIAL